MRSLDNQQLADKLEENQIDGTAIAEAARRLRAIDLQHLLTVAEMAAAVHQSPLIDTKTSQVVEKTIMAVPLSQRSPMRIPSMAGKILSGGRYDHQDVLSLAAFVISISDDVRKD